MGARPINAAFLFGRAGLPLSRWLAATVSCGADRTLDGPSQSFGRAGLELQEERGFGELQLKDERGPRGVLNEISRA